MRVEVKSIKIVRGLPLELAIGVKDNNNSVNINDGTWISEAELRYRTVTGEIPFPLTSSIAGSGISITISSEQSSTLLLDSAGYILIIKISKTDKSVNLRNQIPVIVFDDL